MVAPYSANSADSPLDVCECGDYRYQHDEGWRRCTVCTPNDGMNGRECLMFRLHLQAHLTWTTRRA